MLSKININLGRQKLIVYLVLIVITLAVFWQVNHYDFVNFDDQLYVTNNIRIQSGITLDGIRWAFSTRYADLWNPLVWLSLMFDYQLYGLNAGGYHLTNLILHILSALLLFWLFNRMTGAIWKSAFVAALFAIHPLHVESVAWIAERKDVLSAFFWMLTLCLYTYYKEKPVIRRYLLVLFSFACALMSKPMVITLPIVMILLDYWPLKRFQSQKYNLILWQLREKLPFFILSAVMVIITLYTPDNHNNPDVLDVPYLKQFPFISRLANAPVAFVTYLEKTFWPHDMAIFYPFSDQIPLWQVLGASLLILLISVAVIVMMKRLPYLFAGWMWFVITIAPVIGIIQVSIRSPYAMADRYHYLPSIGLAVMLAWGIPALINSEAIRKKLLFPAGVIFLGILSFLSWNQCGYWKNSIMLFSHTIKVTHDNCVAYNNRGCAYRDLGNYRQAIEDYDRAIELNLDYTEAYNNRGIAYNGLGNHDQAIENFSRAIEIKPDFAYAYYNKGVVYYSIGNYRQAIDDFGRAIEIKAVYADAYSNRGLAYAHIGNYDQAIEDFNRAIEIKPDFAYAYYNRGVAYIRFGNNDLAFNDLKTAAKLGHEKAKNFLISQGISW